jgi:hypothetical protein
MWEFNLRSLSSRTDELSMICKEKENKKLPLVKDYVKE